jgi:hypothetical protein
VLRRQFFTAEQLEAIDAIGAEPDAAYLDMEPEVRRALTVGRQFGA